MKRAADWVVQQHECKQRNFGEHPEQKDLLPVRSHSGQWESRQQSIELKEQEPDLPTKPTSSSSKQVDLDLSDDSVAKLCLKITKDPEQNVNLLSTLRSMLNKSLKQQPAEKEEGNSSCETILYSSLAVFKDIIPSYSIRELTKLELEAKVSKEVQQQRNYEKQLLSSYQQFIKSLQQMIQDKKTSTRLKLASLKSLSSLATNCKEFNFHDQIVAFIVNRILLPNFSLFKEEGKGKACRICCSTLNDLFSSDNEGRISLFVVEAFSSHLQEYSYSNCLHPSILQSLLNLQINEGALRGNEKFIPSHYSHLAPGAKNISRRERKKLKEKVAVINSTRDKSLELEGKERVKRYRDIVKHLFRIYFGILQNYNSTGQKSTTTTTSLLSICLEGLSKFVHLIGVEYFGDLLGSLRSLATIDKLPNEVIGLQLLTAVFKILSLRVESSFFDLKSFYLYLFQLLLTQLSKKRRKMENFSQWEIVFDLMFTNGKTASFGCASALPNQRILSFGSIVCQLTTSVDEKWMNILIKLITKYPILKDELMEEEHLPIQSGNNKIEPQDPDCPRQFRCDSSLINTLIKMKHLKR